MNDFYEILNIEKNATDEEIKKSYRKLVFKHHPDRNKGDKKAEERFKIIANAYETLGNPLKKREYDAKFKQNSRPINNTTTYKKYNTGYDNDFDLKIKEYNQVKEDYDIRAEDFENILIKIFEINNRFTNKKETKPDLKPNNTEKQIVEKHTNVNLQESYIGCIRVLEIFYKDTCQTCLGEKTTTTGKKQKCGFCMGSGYTKGGWCQTCSGTGQVNVLNICDTCKGKGLSMQKMNIQTRIPKGVDENDILLLENEFFKIKLNVHLKNMGRFTRKENDLFMTKKYSIINYLKINSIIITTIDNKKIKIKTPKIECFNDNVAILKIKGKGMPLKKEEDKYGDLFLKIELS
jgi:molecular chaperone DnaJ